MFVFEVWQFASCVARRIPFDQLHGLRNAHMARQGAKQMNVVGFVFIGCQCDYLDVLFLGDMSDVREYDAANAGR